jgi:hypothetical protein
MATVSETTPTIAVGSTKAQDSKANPIESGQSRLEQPERAIKRRKGWPAVGASGDPSRGSVILKLRI